MLDADDVAGLEREFHVKPELVSTEPRFGASREAG
jgi:hypothetical protein